MDFRRDFPRTIQGVGVGKPGLRAEIQASECGQKAMKLAQRTQRSGGEPALKRFDCDDRGLAISAEIGLLPDRRRRGEQ